MLPPPCTWLILSILKTVLATPSLATYNTGISIPITRKGTSGTSSAEERASWAFRQRQSLISKYGANTAKEIKRGSSGTNDLTNSNQDTSYYGSLAIGTPPIAYNIILDTGSADLWLASSSICSSPQSCIDNPTFNPTTSSTFKNLSTPFSINYGSGSARGILSSDVVQLAGFQVSSQTFGLVDQLSNKLLSSDAVSGLMGLGFQTIASSGAKPFWQALVESGAWNQPLMTFYLTRFDNVSQGVRTRLPGGRFTMGDLDESLYTGDIKYTNIPSGQQAYWTIPMDSLTINGQTIGLQSTTGYSAIDTGTTLIAAPLSIVAALYGAIPNSSPGTGSYEGYFFYPCSTQVHLSFTFGGVSWAIQPSDFEAFQVDNQQCVGAVFAINSEDSLGPQWIIGDAFLKNVYSVFRYNPPSVGFAKLSSTAIKLADVNGDLPSATIGNSPVRTGSAPSVVYRSFTLTTLLVLSFALATLL